MKSSERLAREAHSNGPQLDDELCADPEILAAIENSTKVERTLEIVNTDRAALGRLAGKVALKWGDFGFEGKIKLNMKGSAGQSFGCWLVEGMEVKLEGAVGGGGIGAQSGAAQGVGVGVGVKIWVGLVRESVMLWV